MTHLVLCTNSPGELTAWVTPLVRAFNARYPDGYISIYLTPCQYASGQEYAIASQLADRVYHPRETLRQCLFFSTVRMQTRVIAAGGDPVYARLLAWRYRSPASIYTHRRRVRGFRHCFSYPTGDPLMAESTRLARHTASDALHAYTRPYLLVLCGSRPAHFEALLPFMMRAITIARQHVAMTVVLGISPFISRAQVTRIRQTLDLSGVHIYHAVSGGDMIQVMAQARLIITIPGTNTAQSAYLGVPAIVLLPFNEPDKLIIDGLPGLLGRLPVIGKSIMRLLIQFYTQPYYALPNQWLGTGVYPEYVGQLDAATIAQAIRLLWHDTDALARITARLRSLSPEPVSDDIIQTVFSDIV